MGAMSYGGSNIPAKVTSYSVKPVANSIDFTWKVTGTKKNVKALGYLLMVSKDKAALESADPKNPSSAVITSFVTVPSEFAIGQEMTARLSGLEFETGYYAAIAGCDYFSNYSVLSENQGSQHSGQQCSCLEGDDSKVTIHAFENLTVPVRFSDPDGHDVTFALDGGFRCSLQRVRASNRECTISSSPGAGSCGNIFIETRRYRMPMAPPRHSPKEYTILETLLRSCPGSLTTSWSTSIGELHTFQRLRLISAMADGEPLTYVVDNSDGTIAHLNTADGKFYLTTLSFGLTTITVKATDAMGANVSSSFKVLVRDPEVKFLAYPNPVVDMLNLATGEDVEESHVTILSATGGVVFEGFCPGQRLRTCCNRHEFLCPGRYSLILTIGSEEYRKTIVKK